MGIVVCIAMLLGLVQLITKQTLMAKLVAALLLVLGSWNLFWYGLAHGTEFWGIAAIFSGASMISAGLLVFADSSNTPRPVRWIVTLCLAISFLLYAVTLVRLNMGLPIIR